MTSHKFKPERTNGGAYFCDCACGWAGGVYPDRNGAMRAHAIHVRGGIPTGALKPIVQIGFEEIP
jgi:hypothetical protein